MIRPLLFAGIFLATGFALFAQPKIAPSQPKLIVGIVVENFRPEYLYQYQQYFHKEGLLKLMQEGSSSFHVQHNYLVRESLPAYASIVTGLDPSSHGIVGNQWYNKQKGEITEACFDDRYASLGQSAYTGKVSVQNLLFPAVSDRLKVARSGKAKVFSISTDMNAAVLLGGFSANAAFWFDDITGNWVSNTYYQNTLPLWVDQFNAKRLPELYRSRTWSRIYDKFKYPDEFDQNLFDTGFSKKLVNFPYELSKINESNYRTLLQTPFAANLTLDFVSNCIVNEQLGKDDVTDMLMIGFNGFAYAEQIFSPFSDEIADMVYRFDQDIAYLLNFLEKEIGKENVLVYLTSSGQLSLPKEMYKSQRIPSGDFDPIRMTTLLKAYMNAEFGAGEWVVNYLNQQIVLNQKLIKDSRLSVQEVNEKVVDLLMEMSAITYANSAFNLKTMEYQSGTNRLMQASFHPERSGDIFIQLRKGYTEGKSVLNPSENYSDADVPLFFYGWKVRRQVILRPLSVTGIASTLSEILNLPSDAQMGRPIEEILP